MKERSLMMKIRYQLLIAENLSVDTFRNGDPIPEAKTDEEWVKAGENEQPAWCWSTDDPEKRKEYGKLYNWFSVNDPRGLAPQGCRIPTDKELGGLIRYYSPHSELNFPMAGYRHFSSGSLNVVGSNGLYWSGTADGAFARHLVFFETESDWYMLSANRASGFSVRCLKDDISD
jgi:hypothetical protein